MKRIICAVLCVVFLCSCSAKSKVRVVNENVCYAAHIFYGETEYEAWCEVNEECMEVTVEKGAVGLKISVNNEAAVLNYEQKEITLQKGEYDTAFYKLLFDVNSYFDGEYTVKEKNDIYTVGGNASGYDFEMTVSPTGFPIELKIDEIGFSVKYYDILLKKQ